MGAILDSLARGVPPVLALPIEPARPGDPKSGKSPAKRGGQQNWIPLTGWQKGGVDYADLELSDRAGSNCGLLLGCPVDDVSYAAIDIDLLAGNELHRDRLLTKIAEEWGTPILIRETVTYRALILVRVSDTSAGRKITYKLSHSSSLKKPNPINIGKIELLTTGQQCVIAGKHYSGNRILWYTSDRPDEKVPSPPVASAITFKEFSGVEEALSLFLNDIGKYGYTFESSSSREGEIVPDHELAPTWLTPTILVETVSKMKNFLETDRDTYTGVMHAISAAMHGIKAHKGALSAADDLRIAVAAAEWASRWPKATPDAFSIELEKWSNDFSKYPTGGFRSSWSRLIALASGLGYKDAASDDAAREFRAEWKPVPLDMLPIDTTHPDDVIAETAGSELSDIHIADYLRNVESMGENIAWVAGLKFWIIWHQGYGWMGGPKMESELRRTVQNKLKAYTNRFGQEWQKGDRNSVQSATRVRNIVQLLADVTARSPDDINNGTSFLQTPGGTYDLRTLERLSDRQRKRLYDIRYTGVAPSDGPRPTPKFDSLILQLSDGNPEVAEWFLHFLGYSLVGNPTMGCFVVLWGPGGNGKSVLLYVLEKVLGDFYCPLDARVIQKHGKDDHPTALNALRYRRFAAISETERSEKWNETIIKKLSGGDAINARGMHQDMSSFKNESTLFIACNDIPAFSHISRAIIRRFKLIGTTKIPEVDNKQLREEIVAEEGEAILMKLMLYAQVGAKNQMALPETPAAIEAESKEHMQVNDAFYEWASAECEFGSTVGNVTEEFDDLRRRYELWMGRNRAGAIAGDMLNERMFVRSLRNLGATVTDEKGMPLQRKNRSSGVAVRIAMGIRLKVKAVA